MKTYKQLLESDEWKAKRAQILERDKLKCQSCLNRKLIIGLVESTANFVRETEKWKVFEAYEPITVYNINIK